MQITSVLGGYADATAGGRRPEVAERTGIRAAEAATARGLSAPPGTALKAIMADYDLTKITPQRFSEMLDRLHKGGVLTDEEFTQLSQIRLDLDQQGIDENESIDLLDLYGRKTQQLTRKVNDQPDDATGRAALGAAQRRLDWLQKLALVHSAPDSVGLDTVA